MVFTIVREIEKSQGNDLSMKLRLPDYANIAEVVAGVAVVVTLVFLIQSIRENTAAMRANSYEVLLSDVNDLGLIVAQDPELSRIWARYQSEDIDPLTEDHRFRLLLLLRATFRNYEKAYFAFQYGTLGSSEYTRFDETSCGHMSRMTRDLWTGVKDVLTDEYRGYVELLCGTGD
jgi:hypothetical protein